jgi:hypothetical protein
MARTTPVLILAVAMALSVAACGPTEDQSAPPASTPATTAEPSPPSEQPAETPEPTEDAPAEPDGTMTVENSPELAALLAGPATGAGLEAFSDEYGGGKATIRFDGHITYLLASDRATYSTAQVVAGDNGAPDAGPTFEFAPLLLPEDSPLQQDALSEGQNVRITAKVGFFDHLDGTALTEERNWFHLVPVSIEAR